MTRPKYRTTIFSLERQSWLWLFLAAWSVVQLFPSSVFGQEEPVGRIIGIVGTVEYYAGGPEPVAEAKAGEVKPAAFEPWEKVKFKQPVYSYDQFRTGRKSRLKVLFKDSSLMALGPGSTMRVESYLHQPKDKLRQGVINVMHGLSMYIVNKSQKNKKSFFKIVTPTGNIAARGTQGFISTSPEKTMVANKVGRVLVQHKNPNVGRPVRKGALDNPWPVLGLIRRVSYSSGMQVAQAEPRVPGNTVPLGQMQGVTLTVDSISEVRTLPASFFDTVGKIVTGSLDNSRVRVEDQMVQPNDDGGNTDDNDSDDGDDDGDQKVKGGETNADSGNDSDTKTSDEGSGDTGTGSDSAVTTDTGASDTNPDTGGDGSMLKPVGTLASADAGLAEVSDFGDWQTDTFLITGGDADIEVDVEILTPVFNPFDDGGTESCSQ